MCTFSQIICYALKKEPPTDTTSPSHNPKNSFPILKLLFNLLLLVHLSQTAPGKLKIHLVGWMVNYIEA
jgi:hypothetical protein